MDARDPRFKTLDELERDAGRRWDERIAPIPLRWLDREAFWIRFDADYRPKRRALTRHHGYALGLPDLRARIKCPPSFTPFDEYFPGPVERWYGATGDDLFVLTHYYVPAAATTITFEDNPAVEARVVGVMERLRLANPY